MKKSIFLMAVAALAMTSCAKEETLEKNEGHAIDFRAAMGTRAQTNFETSTLQTFHVTALPIDATATFGYRGTYFSDVEFTNGGSGATYKPTNGENYYWPNEGTLEFFAYAPSQEDLGTFASLHINPESRQLIDFQPATTIDNQVDFITATAQGNKEKNEKNGVQLTFKHQLARIGIKAKVAENTTLVYDITGVRIGYVNGKGDFNFPKSAQKPYDPKPDGTVPETAEGITLSEADKGGWTNQENPISYTVEFTATLLGGGSDAQPTVKYEIDLLGGEKPYAMLIPQEMGAWTATKTADPVTTADGAYLAVQLKAVSSTDRSIVVIPTASTTPDHIWAAVPIEANWEAGKTYTYTLDFTNGAGFGAPGEGYKPGEPLLGDPFKIVKVSVSDWETGFANPDDGNLEME